MLKVLHKHPHIPSHLPLKGFLSSDEAVKLCRNCRHLLYGSWSTHGPIGLLTDHGSYEELQQRGDDGSCSVCELVVRTLRQNMPLHASLEKKSSEKEQKVRILHVGRIFGRNRELAGGSFNELRVTINNIERCQLLYAYSNPEKNHDVSNQDNQDDQDDQDDQDEQDEQDDQDDQSTATDDKIQVEHVEAINHPNASLHSTLKEGKEKVKESKEKLRKKLRGSASGLERKNT